MSGIPTIIQNFSQIGLRVSFLCMRDFVPLGQSDSAFFLGEGLLEKGYCRDVHADFDAKYAKRRGSVQGSAFWGSQKPLSKI